MIEVVKFNENVIPPYVVVSTVDDGTDHITRVWDTNPTPPNIPNADTLAKWARDTAFYLKSAMCGWSQITDVSAGMAVVGHMNNGGLGCYGTIAQICTALCAAIDGDREEGRLSVDAVVAYVLDNYRPDPRYGLDALPLPGNYEYAPPTGD